MKTKNFASSHPSRGYYAERLSVSNKNARYIAIEVLNQWEQSRESIDPILEKMLLQYPLSDQRDVNLLKALVFGVLRNLGSLDWAIEKQSSHPLKKMKSRTLCGLRIGLYQLLYMDKIPASAAINETVNALKISRQPKWITGFVNGLLRNIAKEKEKPAGCLSEQNEKLPDAALLNHPQWLLERWQTRFGFEKTLQLCKLNNELPPLTLAVHVKKITTEDYLRELKGKGVLAEHGKYCPDAVCVNEYRGAIQDLPGYQEGYFHVQDEAAQLSTMLLGPFDSAKRYLDGCAGLGGKTVHLGQLAAQNSHITAVESHKPRIKLLRENLERARFMERVEIVHGNLEDYNPDVLFDAVLVDAPCSGLGVIRRHPDIRWNRSSEDLGEYAKKQVNLLDTSAKLLGDGGVLVYVVCSMEPEENEQVIEKFLSKHPAFAVSDAKQYLPETAHEFADHKGYFRSSPVDGLDGFFAARLKKSKE